jgi:hypothetical protein
MHAKWRVVMRLVVAMSYCRSVQNEGFAYKPSNIATTSFSRMRRLEL